MDEDPQVRTPGQYVSFNPNKMFNAIGAALGAKAGANAYEQTGDLGEAAAVGVGAFVRWMCWMLALGLWFFGSFIVIAWETGSYWPMINAILIAPFTLGVTWCRIIDYSLFRRGLIYRIYAPIALMVERVPTVVLYALLLIPLGSG